jgi:RimJ/RimL family protein N-acetyltransferase
VGRFTGPFFCRKGNPVSDAPPVLAGEHVRLEPLERHHVAALLAAAGQELELFKWTSIPQTLPEMAQYVETALKGRAEGTTLAFASVCQADGSVLGSTRFFLIERWAWPPGHARAAHDGADGCEIGYTWLTPGAMRTAANTEAKLLMLGFAFERWQVLRVCFHTDVRNERSVKAMTRMGGKFEGVLRAHRLATDGQARDSARFSIVAAEWPDVKRRLEAYLAAPRP